MIDTNYVRFMFVAGCMKLAPDPSLEWEAWWSVAFDEWLMGQREIDLGPAHD